MEQVVHSRGASNNCWDSKPPSRCLIELASCVFFVLLQPFSRGVELVEFLGEESRRLCSGTATYLALALERLGLLLLRALLRLKVSAKVSERVHHEPWPLVDWPQKSSQKSSAAWLIFELRRIPVQAELQQRAVVQKVPKSRSKTARTLISAGQRCRTWRERSTTFLLKEKTPTPARSLRLLHWPGDDVR